MDAGSHHNSGTSGACVPGDAFAVGKHRRGREILFMALPRLRRRRITTCLAMLRSSHRDDMDNPRTGGTHPRGNVATLNRRLQSGGIRG